MFSKTLTHALAGGSLVAIVMAATPSSAAAQTYGEPSVVVECAPGQRAVMEQTTAYGRPRIVARCVGQANRQTRQVIYDEYGQPVRQRAVYADERPVARRSQVTYVERQPRRSTSKTVLGIAGSAATGAGIGGIVRGKKGALIGAAIGGGAASIVEAAKRR